MESSTRPPIWICDDEPALANTIARMLRPLAGPIHVFTNPIRFLEAWIPGQSGIITLDLLMPDLNGLNVLEQLLDIDPGVPVIAISASTSPSDAASAMKLGARDFLEKPLDPDRLRAVFNTNIGYHDQRQQLIKIKDEIAQMLAPLTEQECRTVFDSIRWSSAKEAARVKDMSVRTVETHRYNISQKLNLGSFNNVKAVVSEYYYRSIELGIDPIEWLWLKN